MRREVELVFRGTNRSAMRALNEISVQADRTASRVVHGNKRSEASFAGLTAAAHKTRGAMGRLAGMAGFGGVAFGMGDAVKGGMALQEHLGQLKAALQDTGVKGAGAFKELSRASLESSVHGGFARDDELNSMTRFVRLTGSATAAVKANQAAVLLARGAHLDFNQAQKYLQQAIVGNVRRLQQYVGVIQPVKAAQDALSASHKVDVMQLDARAKAMGKAGPAWLKQQLALKGITTQEKQHAQLLDKQATAQEVLTRLQGKFAHSLDAFNNTTQGKLSNLRNRYKEIAATLGLALLPIINKVASALSKAAAYMEHHKTVAKALMIAIGALAAMWAGSHIIGLITSTGKALMMLATNPVALTVIGVAALAAGLYLAYRRFKGFRDVVDGVFKWLKNAVSDVVKFIGKHWKMLAVGGALFLGGPFAAAVVFIATRFGQVKRIVRDVIQFIGHWFKKGFDVLTWPFRKAYEFIKGIIEKIGKLPGKIWGGIKHGASSVLHFLGFAHGGVVPPHYMAGGGPVGSDTVPAWLTPGEGVLTQRAVRSVGGGAGVSALNAGHSPAGNITIQPGTTVVRLDSRTIAQAVTEYTLRRAARGPSSLVGGSLVTGSASSSGYGL